MTTIIILIFFTLLVSLLLNNLAPAVSSKYRHLYSVPVFLVAVLSYALLIAQVIAGNPHFSSRLSFEWLIPGSGNLNLLFAVNNGVLIFGAMLATFFIVQTAVFKFFQTDGQTPAANNHIIHRANYIYVLMIAGLLILTADNLMLLFFGMTLITGIVLYQNLFVYDNKTQSGLPYIFIFADILFLIAFLVAFPFIQSLSLSEISATTNRTVYTATGFLIIASIIVKLFGTAYFRTSDHLQSSTGQNVFNLGVISILMILLVRISSILCNACLTLTLIVGIMMALFFAVSSITKNFAGSAFRTLLLAQTGIFLFIIGSQSPINAQIYVVGFTFANLLLIISQEQIQHSQFLDGGESLNFKSGRVWLFLYAAFGITGLLPGIGFIPRNNVILHYTGTVSSSPLNWISLILLNLCLLLIAFAAFRYFFSILYHWKDRDPFLPVSGQLPGTVIGMLIVLNLYLVYTLPYLNPLSSAGRLIRIMSADVYSTTDLNQSYIAAGLATGVPLIGFLVALLTYRFHVIQSSLIQRLFNPFKRLVEFSIRISANFINSAAVTIAKISAGFIKTEDILSYKMADAVAALLNTAATGFTSLSRNISSWKPPVQIPDRISTSLRESFEKYELLIPLLLLIIMIIIFVLSIL